MKKRTKKILIAIPIVIAIAIVSFFVMVYFYFFPICKNTEKEIEIPEELKGISIYQKKDTYYRDMKVEDIKDKSLTEEELTERCNPVLYDIDRALRVKKHMYDPYIDKRKLLDKDTTFRLEKIIVLKPHGIERSFGSDLVFLVLSDENENIYSVATVYLSSFEDDYDDNDVVLAYRDENNNESFLTWDYFRELR